ncbi:DUF58 domain-containing protein [Myxococcota bacterium]|nr:DUF58 domain-containing protein [Myxococcota bacterium]MCZ7617863.1 DUF58 domain-containing protein [Myxococcota bacterium]
MDVRLGPTPPAALARAARLLWIRSRHEASSWLVGSSRSPFRGGGVEFDELRPYEPGDDVRSIDWNATARSGTPWVKRFREERAHTVLVALDVSASMAFASQGRSKLASAARAAALIAAAAQRAGDRVGLATFSDEIRASLPPARGDVHGWRLVRLASEQIASAPGMTRLNVASAWALAQTRRRALVVLLSDFRDPALDSTLARDAASPLAQLASRHDLVAILIDDPREHALVAAGGVRLMDPERGGPRRLLGTGRRQRARYAAAAATRQAALQRRLRREGADPLVLTTPEDPLRALVRFFRARETRGRRAAR